jgi:hypothetical protein
MNVESALTAARIFDLVEENLDLMIEGKPLLVHVENMPAEELALVVNDDDLKVKFRLDGVAEINMVERY